MYPLLPAGTTAAVLSLVFTWLLICLSRHLHLVSEPRSDRWHNVPRPSTGGLGVLLACTCAYAMWATGQHRLLATLAATMGLLGFLDDRVQLRPEWKFLGQAAITAVALAGGIVCPITGWPPLNIAITFLWITGVTNAFNLIDNMDSLCAGVTVIICGFRLFTALQTGDLGGALLLAILGSAFLGFLVFNYKPAKIFMGDCGSMFAGFTLAALAVASPAPHTKAFLSAIVYPALTFLYPIFDTLLVSLLRRAAGRPIWVGGLDHSSHRLVSLVHSEEKVVWLLWSITAAGAGIGLMAPRMPFGGYAAGIALAIGVGVFGLFLGTLPGYPLPDGAPVKATRIRHWIPTLSAAIALIADVLLAGVALLTAYLLRWEDAFVGEPSSRFLFALPIVLGCQAASSIAFGTFRSGWRWFGATDVAALVKCNLTTCAAAIPCILIFGARGYTVVVFVLFALLELCLSVGMRALMWLLRETLGQTRGARRAVVLGAGRPAQMWVRFLRNEDGRRALPVLVLETDPAFHKLRMHGVPIRYAGADLDFILNEFRAELLVVPTPVSELPVPQRKVIEACLNRGMAVEQVAISATPLFDLESLELVRLDAALMSEEQSYASSKMARATA